MSAHLLFAHLPFVLFLAGAALDVLGIVTRDERWRRWAGGLLIAGALAALFAFSTGQGALGYALARPQADHGVIEAHTRWGGAGVWLLAVGGGLRLAWRRHLHGAYGWINLVTALVSALVVVAITRSGLAIAHGL